MIELILKYNFAFSWFFAGEITVKGIALNEKQELLQDESLAKHFLNISSMADFKARLSKLDGIFSVVVKKEELVWAAVDPLRNIPLLFKKQNGNLCISDDYQQFAKNSKLNIHAVEVLQNVGYVMGCDTLIEDVAQLQAGECLFFDGKQLLIDCWYRAKPSKLEYSTENEWKKVLKELLLKIGFKMSKLINNHPVALPLSGGFDSRLIALLLKMNKCDNVFCFTYGDPKHKEVLVSEEIANRLGFPWMVIDYAPFIGENYLQSDEFAAYVDFFGNGISFPYIQEYFAARYLKKEYGLPENTLFLPGHSGDMLAGSHLMADMKSFKSKKDLARKILRRNGSQLFYKPQRRNFLFEELEKNIFPELFQFSHWSHDDWNIAQRQSKQIVNSSKVWNYFGYQYLLPLWDKELIDFFASVPFELRLYKKLYHDVLKELFLEYNILLPHEMERNAWEGKKKLLKVQIKDYFPFIVNLKRNVDTESFFFFKELLSPIENELPPFNPRNGSAILSEWYIQHVSNNLKPKD